MAKLRLKYVNSYRDRHGKFRHYFRRPGSQSVGLPGLPGSIEFIAAYQEALASVAPPPASPAHVGAGTVAAAFYGSADFANLKVSSQKTYRMALDPIVKAHGHRLVRDMPKMAARKIIEEIGAKHPGMANLTRAALSKLMGYAIATRLRVDNPFAGLTRYRMGTFHTWTDVEIEQFERRWRLGTREGAATVTESDSIFPRSRVN